MDKNNNLEKPNSKSKNESKSRESVLSKIGHSSRNLFLRFLNLFRRGSNSSRRNVTIDTDTIVMMSKTEPDPWDMNKSLTKSSSAKGKSKNAKSKNAQKKMSKSKDKNNFKDSSKSKSKNKSKSDQFEPSGKNSKISKDLSKSSKASKNSKDSRKFSVADQADEDKPGTDFFDDFEPPKTLSEEEKEDLDEYHAENSRKSEVDDPDDLMPIEEDPDEDPVEEPEDAKQPSSSTDFSDEEKSEKVSSSGTNSSVKSKRFTIDERNNICNTYEPSEIEDCEDDDDEGVIVCDYPNYSVICYTRSVEDNQPEKSQKSKQSQSKIQDQDDDVREVTECPEPYRIKYNTRTSKQNQSSKSQVQESKSNYNSKNSRQSQTSRSKNNQDKCPEDTKEKVQSKPQKSQKQQPEKSKKPQKKREDYYDDDDGCDEDLDPCLDGEEWDDVRRLRNGKLRYSRKTCCNGLELIEQEDVGYCPPPPPPVWVIPYTYYNIPVANQLCSEQTGYRKFTKIPPEKDSEKDSDSEED